MKKPALFLLSLLLLLTLCACGKKDVYDVEYEGTLYTVDTVNSTITFDGHACKYELSDFGEMMILRVTYPDGSTFFKEKGKGISMGSGSPDYDENRYVPGETLWAVLGIDQTMNQNKALGLSMGGLVLVILGVFFLRFPRAVWMGSHGWLFKNAEPTDAAVVLARFQGALLILVGVGILIYALTLIL